MRMSRLGCLIHRLRVHRAAVLRVRMREDDGRADTVGASAGQAVGRRASRAGSSSSASSRPAGPGISTRHGKATSRSRDRAGHEIARRRKLVGRVIDPRCPVRSSCAATPRESTTDSRPSPRPARRDRASRSPVIDECRRRDARAIRRCPAWRSGGRERPSAESTAAPAPASAADAREAPARAASGKRLAISRPIRHGVSARNSGPSTYGAARNDFVPRGRSCQPGPGVETSTSAGVRSG